VWLEWEDDIERSMWGTVAVMGKGSGCVSCGVEAHTSPPSSRRHARSTLRGAGGTDKAGRASEGARGFCGSQLHWSMSVTINDQLFTEHDAL
jgi:hypothetical protein